MFRCRCSPEGGGDCSGICIFDATNGSLRLTERLRDSFQRVVERALESIEPADEPVLAASLGSLLGLVAALGIQETGGSDGPIEDSDEDWLTLVAPGQTASRIANGVTTEVKVLGFRYTTRGMMYELEPRPGFSSHMVPKEQIHPIPGETDLARHNPMTGETEVL